jgi:hypothetical protein
MAQHGPFKLNLRPTEEDTRRASSRLCKIIYSSFRPYLPSNLRSTIPSNFQIRKVSAFFTAFAKLHYLGLFYPQYFLLPLQTMPVEYACSNQSPTHRPVAVAFQRTGITSLASKGTARAGEWTTDVRVRTL